MDDSPRKDPTESDEDASSEGSPAFLKVRPDDDEIDKYARALWKLDLEEERAKTPTDQVTGPPNTPLVPRVKELREETLNSPTTRKPSRASRKLDFPLDAHPSENSPEKSPEDNPCAFGKELYDSLPGSSTEALKLRSNPIASVNPFFLLGSRSTCSKSRPLSSLNPPTSLQQLCEAYARDIVSNVITESLESIDHAPLNPTNPTLGSNVVIQPPAISQVKRTLEKSPTESPASPSVVKRHRRVPSAELEERPVSDVRRRRKLSFEAGGNDPEVKREPRKRSHSSGEEKTEVREKQRKTE